MSTAISAINTARVPRMQALIFSLIPAPLLLDVLCFLTFILCASHILYLLDNIKYSIPYLGDTRIDLAQYLLYFFQRLKSENYELFFLTNRFSYIYR